MSVTPHDSLVIVLGVGGAPPDAAALAQLGDGVAVLWSRAEREGSAACLAAGVCHWVSRGELRARVRAWGAARGWVVAVAPPGSAL